MQSSSELAKIKNQLIAKYNPQKIILFGSQAKGTARKNSDIDICIIAETKDKRKLLTDMYFSVDSDVAIDFLIYTPLEWNQCVNDKYSFASKLNAEGVVLHE